MAISMPSTTRFSAAPQARHGRPDRLPRTRAARPAAPAVREPDPAGLPDWSADTLERLEALTPLQQAMVQWRAAGHSAAEAYRLATGRDAPSAKQSAHQVFARPEVAAALAAALHDRNFVALYDRGWMILKLKQVVDECAEMRTPAAGNTLITALVTMAKLQGELPMGRRGCRRPAAALPEPAGRSAVRERIQEILADVARLTGAPRPPAPTPPGRLDQLVAAADAPASRPRPRAAVVDQLVVAPPASLPAAEAGPPGPAEPADNTPPPPADGLPLGVVRPFIPPRRPAPPAAGEPGPAEPLREGPVVPRGSDGPVRYRGAAPYFLGCWA
jgi:hypothetical protein